MLEFGLSATESDVEQAFIWPLLIGDDMLGIPDGAVRTKQSIATVTIDKGAKSKRYAPDYMVYSQGLPLLVIEAKAPSEALEDAFREAQLYAHTLNTRWSADIDPAHFVAATNGVRIRYGHWNSADAAEEEIKDLLPGSAALERLQRAIGWPAVERHAYELVRKITPNRFTSPHEQLGETTVRLSKIPDNPFSESLFPVLQKYFQDNSEFDSEIIDRAYVSSEETTRYQRVIEDFLRERIAPLSDSTAQVLAPTKREEPALNKLISGLSQKRNATGGYLQLVIGAVGSGKSTFLKRYFRRLISADLRNDTIVVFADFNQMPDDLSEINRWLSEIFIESIFSSCGSFLDRTDPECLKRIFSVEVKNNLGAYNLLRKASEEKYNERLASDLLNWMSDPVTFARALSRHVAGDRGKFVVVVFDNVDRRDRESQLSVFQTAQWFRRQTNCLALLCLRDETYENYKAEPPLDAFLNSLHFYIRPPRFVDMVKKRLDLAIEYVEDHGVTMPLVEVPGLGRVRLKEQVGQYLKAIYVDLFQKQRRTTVILEGLSGRNVRRALGMFSNILVSGHIEMSDLAATMISGGVTSIREANLIRALMRTNYLYFYDGHGFVSNIYDFAPGVKRPNHFLKIELLDFLARHRKKIGDARYEGYFSVQFLVRRFVELGFPEEDTLTTLSILLTQHLIIADHLRSTDLSTTDLVRIHVSGFVHLRVLGARVDYVASCALITPMASQVAVRDIARLWQINPPHSDISRRNKMFVTQIFKAHLESQYRQFCENSPFFAEESLGTRRSLRQLDDILGFVTGGSVGRVRDQDLFD